MGIDINTLAAAKNYVDETLTGAGGLKGEDGFSPVVAVKESSDTVYKLEITTAAAKFETPNLMASVTVEDTLSADSVNPVQSKAIVEALADKANTNLLINPDFRVNQRSKSGVITETGYFVDGWQLVNGTVTINADGTLTLDGTIKQILENAVGGTTLPSASAGTASYDDSTKTFTLTASGETITWAKLELGSIATPFVPPDPATELVKCQRYFVPLFDKTGTRVQFNGVGLAIIDTMVRFQVNLPVSLRLKNPTVTLDGTLYIIDGMHNTSSSNSIVVDGVRGSYVNGNILQLDVSVSSSAAIDRTTAYMLCKTDVNTALNVSAEL